MAKPINDNRIITKITELTAIFLIQLIITIPFYTASVYGLTISNVRVTKTTPFSATIDWSTDKPSDGIVAYGKTTALGFKQRHSNYLIDHSVIASLGVETDT